MTVNELQEQHGVVLRSVTEPIDTATPMGAMIFAILASFAAEERRVITSRTLAGKKHKAMRGGFAGETSGSFFPPTRPGKGTDTRAPLTITAACAWALHFTSRHP